MKTMVILPTYNEAHNLPGMVAELLGLGIAGLQILVVDDNSPDGTGQIAEELRGRYPNVVDVIHRPGKMGLGTAYVAGFRHALQAGADRIVQMDADFSHSPSYLPHFLELLNDYDVVVGSRYVPGGKLDDKWGLWRRLLSGFGNHYAAWVTGTPLHDLTTGYRCFTREALTKLPLDRLVCNGYAFMIEISYAFYRAGCRMREEPIAFEDRILGRSKMSTKIILEALWRVWQIRWRY